MAQRILFLMHGIGQRAPEGATDKQRAAVEAWPTDPIALLTKLAKKYAPDVELSLNPGPDGVRIVPLSYCDIIIRELEAWDEFGSSDVAAAFGARFPQLGAGRLAQLGGISTRDANYFWGGPVDVVLYRLFFDRDIRAHVREQIARSLSANSPGGTMPSAVFIAHSMGTSVLHDTLAELLAAPELFGAFANMDVHLYASISNVSKILQTDINPHASAVRPFGADGDTRTRAGVRAFLNAHHVADPVAHIGMFRPKWDPARSFYLDVEIERLKWIDTHGLVHYLENPRVHIPILRATCGAKIDNATEKKAITAYDATVGDECPEALNALRTSMQKITKAWDDRGDATGPIEFAVALTDVLRTLDEARTACKSASGEGQ